METAPGLISWPIVVAAMFLAVLVLAVGRMIVNRRRLGVNNTRRELNGRSYPGGGRLRDRH